MTVSARIARNLDPVRGHALRFFGGCAAFVGGAAGRIEEAKAGGAVQAVTGASNFS